MKKDSIIFYAEWLSLINSLSEQNRLKFYDLLFSHMDGEDIPKIDDPHLRGVVDFVMIKVKANNGKYEEKRQQAIDAANKRWKKDDAKNADASERMPNFADVDSAILNVNDNVNVNVKEKKEKGVYEKKLKKEKEKKEIILYGNVMLTKSEHEDLVVQLGGRLEKLAKDLSDYYKLNAKNRLKYDNDYYAILNFKKRQDENPKNKSTTNTVTTGPKLAFD